MSEQHQGTRRVTATVLVTDLVGSTAQRSALGEERADELRREHDRIMRTVIESAGGVVVKSRGDGLLAWFGSATDAVEAAVGVHVAAARGSRAHPDQPFVLRVGLSAGDIVLEEGDCFGGPVIEASRLGDGADPGEILAADLVRLLARGRGGYRFEPLGDLELKGLDEPVPVSRVAWTAPTAVSIPPPPDMVADRRFPFVGRQDVIEHLLMEAKRAHEERRVVLVSGEPGVGKTRLVAEVATRLAVEGSVVLFGRADEEVPVSFGPVREMIAHLVRHIDEASLAEHVAEHGAAVGAAVAEVAPRLQSIVEQRHQAGAAVGGAATDELVTLEALTDLLMRVSGPGPTLLVFDDLHWADHSSLRLVRHLARSRTPGVLVVGTYRDTDLVRTHPLAGVLADLRRQQGVTRLDLGGLTPAEVLALMQAAAGHELDEDGVELSAAIHAETEGNAFFVGEVLAHLAESGAIVQRDGRWEAADTLQQIGVPEGIREVIGRRLATLGPEADDVLHAAAVIGPEVDVALVAGVVGREVDDVLGVVEGAVALGLFAEVPGQIDRFRFVHALVRQSLVEELSASRRVRYHAAVADALTERGTPELTLLAHHACEAAPLRSAADATELATRVATTAQVDESLVWHQRALAAEELIEPPDPARRARLLFSHAIAHFVAADVVGSRPPAQQAFELAIEAYEASRDPAMAALACRCANFVGAFEFLAAGGREPAMAMVERAEQLDLPSAGPTARAIHLSARGFLKNLDHDPTEMQALADQAVAAAREAGDVEVLEVALRLRGVALTRDRTEERAAVGRELQELAAAPGRRPLVMRYNRALARFEAMGAAIATGDLVAATDMAEVIISDRTDPDWRNGHLILAAVACARGDLDGAAAHGALSLSPDAPPALQAMVSLNALRLAELRGDWDAYQRAAGEIPRHLALTELIPLAATSLARDGQDDAAADVVRTWAHRWLPLAPHFVVPGAIVAASRAWRALDADTARAMLAMCARYGVSTNGWVGAAAGVAGPGHRIVARFAAATGDDDRAIALLEEALGEHDRGGDYANRSETATDLAELLIRRARGGDLDAARHHADTALAAARRLRLDGLVPGAESVLRRL